MDFLAIVEWFKTNGLAVAGVLGVLAAVFMGIKNYTVKTETKADDKLGDVFGWIGGLIKAIFSSIPGVKK